MAGWPSGLLPGGSDLQRQPLCPGHDTAGHWLCQRVLRRFAEEGHSVFPGLHVGPYHNLHHPGVIAGALGRLFGDVGGFWKYVLPPVAIILGLFLLGVFKLNISVPQRFMPKQKALLGAFLMGLFFGIVASPCATPVLAVILTFAATQKRLAYSGALLLCYALGHWILVLGAGISAGFAQKVLASKGIASFSNYSKRLQG